MDEPSSKKHLREELRSARREWEQLLIEVDTAQMARARTVGDWSVKGVLYHATRYARLFVQALEAHSRGDPPPPEVLATPDIDERNAEHFRQSEQRTLGEVLDESRQVFDRLIELVELQSESFLSEPQQFEGVPETVLVGKNLLHVCNHYRAHVADIRARIESDSSKG